MVTIEAMGARGESQSRPTLYVAGDEIIHVNSLAQDMFPTGKRLDDVLYMGSTEEPTDSRLRLLLPRGVERYTNSRNGQIFTTTATELDRNFFELSFAFPFINRDNPWSLDKEGSIVSIGPNHGEVVDHTNRNIDPSAFLGSTRSDILRAVYQTALEKGRITDEVHEIAQVRANSLDRLVASGEPFEHQIEIGDRLFHLRARPLVVGGDFHGYNGFTTDVTTNIREREELVRRAMTDPLTGLPNRLSFDQDLEMTLRQRSPYVGVIATDLRHFKRVNDTHGHSEGDELLRQVGRFRREELRPKDQMYRMGGDEFYFILTGNTPEEIIRNARIILNKFSAYNFKYAVSMDAGLVLYQNSNERNVGPIMATLVRQADNDSYAIKRARKGLGTFPSYTLHAGSLPFSARAYIPGFKQTPL